MYQGISSARLPAQMIRNWENERYPQSMVNARSRLPRSLYVSGLSSPSTSPRPRDQRGDEDHERDGRDPLADDQEDAVERRKPRRLQRHPPVDQGERDREEVDDQARGADGVEPVGQDDRPGLVQSTRTNVEEQGQPDPEREVDPEPDIEGGRIQPDFLELEVGRVVWARAGPIAVAGSLAAATLTGLPSSPRPLWTARTGVLVLMPLGPRPGGVHPGVDLAQVEQHGDEQDGHQGERHGRGFQGPADQEAPGPAELAVDLGGPATRSTGRTGRRR